MNELELLLEQTMRAYRVGRERPVLMSQAASGDLARAMAQSSIRARLGTTGFLKFSKFRDDIRTGVKLARQGKIEESDQTFKKIKTSLEEKDVSMEISLLGKSWLSQAQAFAATQHCEWNQAVAFMLEALELDALLEEQGFLLFHAHRIHLFHLLSRIAGARGNFYEAAQLAELSSEYAAGRRESLPLGRAWDLDLLKKTPLVLRNSMRLRLAGEIGNVLAEAGPEDSVKIFKTLQSWQHCSDRPVLLEVFEWGQLKAAFLEQQLPAFLALCRAFLEAGRRDTTLWYAAAFDLYEVIKKYFPNRADNFREELLLDAFQWEKLSAKIFPRRWENLFRSIRTIPERYSKKQISTAFMETISNLPSNKSLRRFRIYNLGLPRSGTRSIARIFGNYRADHEFQFQETLRQILAWKGGRLGEEEFRKFLHLRDGSGELEMDAAFFHQYHLQILLQEFPDARFIFTIRDLQSWISSFTDMLVRWRRHYEVIGREIPTWQVEYGKFLFRDFDPDLFSRPEQLKAEFPRIAESLVNVWIDSNQQILKIIPNERLLILRTDEISKSLEKLADFAGVPSQSLLPEKSWSNPAPYRFDWAGSVDPKKFARPAFTNEGNSLCSLFADRILDEDAFPALAVKNWDNYLEQHRNFSSKNHSRD